MAQFITLTKRYEQAEEWLDFRTGIICSVIANANRTRNSRVWKPQDFMPKRKERTRVPKKQTPEQLLQTLQIINTAHGGQVVEIDNG